MTGAYSAQLSISVTMFTVCLITPLTTPFRAMVYSKCPLLLPDVRNPFVEVLFQVTCIYVIQFTIIIVLPFPSSLYYAANNSKENTCTSHWGDITQILVDLTQN